MTMPPLPPEPAEDKDAKKREKEAKRLEAGQGLIELADRQARFALVMTARLTAPLVTIAAWNLTR